MSMNFRFSKETHLRIGLFQDLIQIPQRQPVTVPFHYDGTGSSRSMKCDIRDRQAKHRTGVQSELRQILRNHRHHSGIVRTGGNLAKYDIVSFNE